MAIELLRDSTRQRDAWSICRTCNLTCADSYDACTTGLFVRVQDDGGGKFICAYPRDIWRISAASDRRRHAIAACCSSSGDPVHAMVGDMRSRRALRAALENASISMAFLQRLYGICLIFCTRSWLLHELPPSLPGESWPHGFSRTLVCRRVGYCVRHSESGSRIGIHSAVTPHEALTVRGPSLVLIGYALRRSGLAICSSWCFSSSWLSARPRPKAWGNDLPPRQSMAARAGNYLCCRSRPTHPGNHPRGTFSCERACRTLQQLQSSRRAEGCRGARSSWGIKIFVALFDSPSHCDWVLVRHRHGWCVFLERSLLSGRRSLMVEVIRSRDTQVIVGVVILIACRWLP